MSLAASQRGRLRNHGHRCMTIAWVLGSGGLLGGALCRALRRDGIELFLPTERFSWVDGHALDGQIAAAVQAFASRLNANEAWQIYWAAGVGSMGSAQDALAAETHALKQLLQRLEAEPSLMSAPGAIAFASSAGAIYAGARDAVITERTPPTPTTAYAREKLLQEDLIRAFVLTNQRTAALLARISTIYGPGQATGKQQGLLTHIARRILRNQPIQIYVPYDTIRDYIAVDDAATAIISAQTCISRNSGAVVKIVASESPTTIAEIVSIFKRLARRAPRIVTSASKLSTLYSRRVQFRSVALPECAKVPGKSLVVGIAQLIESERQAFVQTAAP